MIAWMKSGNGNISFIANGKQYQVTKDHESYTKVLQGLVDNLSESELVEIVDKSESLKKFLCTNSNAYLSVEGSTVSFTDEDGSVEALDGVLVETLLDIVKQNLPVQGLVNFVKKCMDNPDYQIIAESGLFEFLSHRNMPICEDGDFLAYKAVTNDYKDKYTNSYDNSVGSVVKEKRRRVNSDRNVGCSSGLHAGTYSYASGFARSDDKVVIVKINPKNVVSIPKDSNCQKLRCCEYMVVQDCTGIMDFTLAKDSGEQLSNNVEEEDGQYDWWEYEEDDTWEDEE